MKTILNTSHRYRERRYLDGFTLPAAMATLSILANSQAQLAPAVSRPASRPAVTAGKPFDQRVAVTLAQAMADIQEYPPAPGDFHYFRPVTGGFTSPLGQRADAATQRAAQPAANPALRLRIDPKKLALFNLSLADVRKALAEQNIAVASERVDAAGQHELDLDPDRLPKPEIVGRMAIKTKAGVSVPLQQFADVLAVAGDDGTAQTRPTAAQQPTEKAARRAEGLKKTRILHVELQYFGPEPEKETGLFLHSDSADYKLRFRAQTAHISPEQCQKIIDYLALEGFLDKAADHDVADPQPQGPTYQLRVYWGKGFYAEDLGWNPDMLRRLDGLRKVLDGNAGEAMHEVLARLKPLRASWEQPAARSAETTVVTKVDKDAFLKELRGVGKRSREEVGESGWAASFLEAKKGEVFQLAVAVCSSREAARSIYRRQELLLSVMPRPLVECKVGDIRTSSRNWAFFVRDNVFVSVSWKNGVVDSPMLERLDKLLMTDSPMVARGRFDEVPQLKGLPAKVEMTAGETKSLPVTCTGMGQKPAMWYVSSPGSMNNRVVDATVRLEVRDVASEERFPVTVCAVGEGLVFATATVDATVKPTMAHPAAPQTKGAGSDKLTSAKQLAGAQPSAAFTPLAPKVDPLPQAEIDILFKKIGKVEKIELIKLYQALKGPQTTLRAYAARELGKYGDKSSVPYLIDALSDESMHVGARHPKPGMETTRYWANDSLKKLTGKDFGFIWNEPVEKRNHAITQWREWFNRETVTDPKQQDQSNPEKLSPEGGQSTGRESVRERALQEGHKRLLAAEQAELARGVAERDQRTALEHARADEIAAANQKAEQAKAAISPEFTARIKAMLPDGWSVAAEKDVLTIRRDEKVEADYMSPVGMMPERISTSDVILIRVGPRISAELYAPMAAENTKVRQELLAKHPGYDPVDNPISRRLPHVLPTHFDERHSLWISSKLLHRGHVEFKSKEVFDECWRVYAGVEGMFHHYSDTKGGVAQSPLLKGVIALRNAEELAEAIRRRMPANWRVVKQRVADWSAGGRGDNWPRGCGMEIVIQRQGFQPLDLKRGRGGQVVLAMLELGYTPPRVEENESQAGNAAYLGPWRYPGVFGMIHGGTDWPIAKADIQAAMKASQPSQPPSAGSIRVSEVQGFATRLSGIMPANWEVASLEHRETGGPGWPKGDAVVIELRQKVSPQTDQALCFLTLAVMLDKFTPAEPLANDRVLVARQWGTYENHAVFVLAACGNHLDWPNMERDVCGLLEAAAPPAKGAGSEKPDAAKQASIAGSVESLHAKEPVANARVLIQGTTTNGKSWSLESTTDTEGRFLVEAVPPERPVVVVVSKVMEGMGWFQVQAETTLTPGEKGNLGVLRAGVMPPPLATPENAQNIEAYRRRVSALEANYRRAIETEGQTTAPYYVLVQVVNAGTRETRTVCVEPSQLLRALCMEMNLPATAEGLEKAKETALKQADRVFRFSTREAIALAQPRYTAAILTEVRQYLKNVSTEDAAKQIMDQTSALYKFCNKNEESLHAYLDAVAHVFMENGLACGRSCKPGLIFVEIAQVTSIEPQKMHGDPAIQKHILTIRTNPSTQAKKDAGEALARIGLPALAPLMDYLHEVARAKKYTGYIHDALSSVCKRVGPEAEKVILARFLGAGNVTERECLFRALAVGASYPKTLGRLLGVIRNTATLDANTKWAVREVVNLYVDGGGDGGIRDEGAISELLGVFAEYPELPSKHAEIQNHVAVLKTVGVPAENTTFRPQLHLPLQIAVDEQTEFFVALPRPNGAWGYQWGFEKGRETDPTWRRHGLCYLGRTLGTDTTYFRFIGMHPVKTQLDAYIQGGAPDDDPAEYPMTVTVRALSPEERARKLRELSTSVDDRKRKYAEETWGVERGKTGDNEKTQSKPQDAAKLALPASAPATAPTTQTVSGSQFAGPESVLERIRHEERKLLREEGKKTPNGQRDGLWRFYGPEGQLMAEGMYDNGTIAKGTIAQVRHFKDDRPLELWRTSYENGRMTRFEKYVEGKWCMAKYAYCKRHDYRGKEWAGCVGWSEEIVLQEARNPPELVAGAIWAAAQKKVELSLRGNSKTTHAFLVQDPVRDTPGVVSQEEFAAGTKRKIEKFDGRTWSQVSQAEIERLGKPGSDPGNPSKEPGDAAAWGESANDLQAGLTLKSTNREPRAGAVLAFHLRNAGDKPIKILKLAAQARFWGEHLPLEIRSSETILKYQGPLLEPGPPPGEHEYITLNPGDTDSTEVTFVPERWKLAVPFEAQMVFVFQQTLRENKTAGPHDDRRQQWRTAGGLWTGEARSQAVRVKMGVQTIGEEGSPISGLKITRDQAASIAGKHLEAESFASTYDAARITVRYCPNYGEPKAPFACWMVDFAKVGTGEIIAGSGQWEMGYMVLVDPDTGKVKEATGYKR